MGLFSNIAWQVAQKQASKIKVPSKIRKNASTIKKLIGGDLSGVAEDLINKQFGLTRSLGGFGTGIPFGQASPLIGGINIDDVRQIYEQAAATEYSKKNLWALSIVDLKESDSSTSQYANFFATDVQFSEFSGAGNAQKAGSGFFDIPENRNPTEFNITTLDDAAGTIKQWFRERFNRTFLPDGSHGIPIDYLMLVEIQHSIISGGMGTETAYVARKICRVGMIDNSLSRREDAMEEINFTLVEHDSFLPI